jgi:hypothetical protein
VLLPQSRVAALKVLAPRSDPEQVRRSEGWIKLLLYDIHLSAPREVERWLHGVTMWMSTWKSPLSECLWIPLVCLRCNGRGPTIRTSSPRLLGPDLGLRCPCQKKKKALARTDERDIDRAQRGTRMSLERALLLSQVGSRCLFYCWFYCCGPIQSLLSHIVVAVATGSFYPVSSWGP